MKDRMCAYLDNDQWRKDLHNTYLVETTLEYLWPTGLLALDGHQMRTTKKWRQHYDCPVYLAEKDARTFAQQKEQKLPNVSVNKCTMDKLLPRLKKSDDLSKINVAYFDYTCTARGCPSKNIYPMDAIDYFLRHNGHSRVILAVTFAGRVRRHYDMSPLDEARYHLMYPCIKFNQYQIVDEPLEFTYKCKRESMPMIFLLYKLKRNLKIKPELVDFLVEDGRFVGYSEECADRYHTIRNDQTKIIKRIFKKSGDKKSGKSKII